MLPCTLLAPRIEKMSSSHEDILVHEKPLLRPLHCINLKMKQMANVFPNKFANFPAKYVVLSIPLT